MKRINLKLKGRSYPILIGRGLLGQVGQLLRPFGFGQKILVVSNRKVAKFYLETVTSSLRADGFDVASYFLPHGDERDKSQRTLIGIWEAMAKAGLDRSSTALALGGGVVGDVTGFAASSYMRGISVIQVPTSLLGQVDSAIGGKTAIDLPQAKNIVGAFYQPRAVIVDVKALKTLPREELRYAFSEIIKYGVIGDSRLFSLLERRTGPLFESVRQKSLSDKDLEFLEEVVWRSAAAKARVVEQDECEKTGKRMILNYGHTFAHGLEAASKYKMPHGEAVAFGMVLAGELARRLRMFSDSEEERQINLIRCAGLPTSLRQSRHGRQIRRAEEVLSFMRRDKKARSGQLRFVLPRRIGAVTVCDHVPKEVVLNLLKEFVKPK